MTIYFSNPGSLDLRLLSTFGVTVKPGTKSPVGKFGSGMKHAIAGVLRLGGTVTIASDGVLTTLFAKTETIRGEAQQMVWAKDDSGERPLPFSTNLGAHWEPWMLYREFHCNATDEGGPAIPATCWPKASGPQVIFAVQCPEVEAVRHQHHTYFLPSGLPLAYTTGDLQVFAGSSNHFYYKGVKVFTSKKPFLFTYNLLDGLSLTEDRTASDWTVQYELTAAAARSDKSNFQKALLLAGEGFAESNLVWEHLPSYIASPTFKTEVAAAVTLNRTTIHKGALAWAGKNLREQIGVASRPPSASEASMILAATEHLMDHCGIHFRWPVKISLEDTMTNCGFALAGCCYLHPQTFSDLPKLFSTMLEEHIHLSTGHRDFTREFQEDLHQIIQQMVFGAAKPPVAPPAQAEAFLDSISF